MSNVDRVITAMVITSNQIISDTHQLTITDGRIHIEQRQPLGEGPTLPEMRPATHNDF